MNKVAVVIADSYGKFFESIKDFNEKNVWTSLKSQGIDVYYTIGLEPKANYQKFATFREKMRFTQFAKLFEFLDLVLLFPKTLLPPKGKINENTIEVSCLESLRTLGIKDLISIEKLRTLEYNIIVKTTLSSLVNPKAFLELVRNVDQNSMFYGGPLVAYKTRTFVSGSFVVINAKTADFLIKRRRRWNNGKLDDLAIFGLLGGKVKQTAISSLSISSYDEIKGIDENTLAKTVHFRCKSSELDRKDLQIMKELMSRLN